VFFISDTTEKRKNANKYNNLFVGNIGPDVTEQELRDKFGEFGEIESMLRPTRKLFENGENITINKSHCFVSFKDPNNASDVIKMMDGQFFWNRKLSIDYYKPRDQMVQKTQADNSANMAEAFMQMMVSTMGSMANNMNSGKCVCVNLSINPSIGGYGGPPSQNYRGGNNYGNNYNRGGRGSRGSRGHRGGRGAIRGAPPGGPGGYNVRSQYEQKPMGQMGRMPPMGPPPSFNQMGSNMGNYGSMPPQNQAPQSMMHNQPPQQMMQNHSPQGLPSAGAPVQQQKQSNQAPPQKDSPLELGHTLEEIEKMEKSDQENVLGTYLYDRLAPLCGGEVAGKITGMFLDLAASEVYEIATDPTVFNKYYGEAMALIQQEGQEGQEEQQNE